MAMASSSRLLSLFLLQMLAASSPGAVLASAAGGGGGDHGLTHIHLYVHETLAGANATVAAVAASPLGGNSSFGSIRVTDHTSSAPAVTGRRSSSQLLGQYQLVMVGTSLGTMTGGAAGYLTSISLVFTAGEHAGSSLKGGAAVERAVVGGTGRFRLARGYSLTTILGNPTPETVLLEVDLYVLVHGTGKHH